MRKTLTIALCVLFAITMLSAVASAKNTASKWAEKRFENSVQTRASDLDPLARAALGRPSLSSAVTDTFHLAWFSFEGGGGGFEDKMGFTEVDNSAQPRHWHVADDANIGTTTFGTDLTISGSQSFWCGVRAQATPPYCGYVSLPGYGNNWDQILTTNAIAGADSFQISYDIVWDSEPGYDATVLQFKDGGGNWNDVVSVNAAAGLYDGTGALTEAAGAGAGSGVEGVRFRFSADGAWSDQDGLWPTDGAASLDDITIQTFSGGSPAGTFAAASLSNFEAPAAGDSSHTSGDWHASNPNQFGEFGELYQLLVEQVVQEDPCFMNFTHAWAWFDEPTNANYACATPTPFPGQGAFPFGGASKGGLYMSNEVWSPTFDYDTDTGGNAANGSEVRLSFLTYRDLPLDNLQFYIWGIRSWISGCPGNWRDLNFVYFGPQKDWLRTTFSIGSLVEPGVEELQISVGAVDACGFWCNVFGTGSCHSHAPIIDEIHLARVGTTGPQFVIRHLDLFNDNFATDGTTTGTVRADAANDITPSTSTNIQPGDSVRITVSDPADASGLSSDGGGGPAVYTYVAVWNGTVQPYAATALQSSHTEPTLTGYGGLRYPFVGTTTAAGVTWYCYRMDSARTTLGATVADQYVIDLNDNILTPCDTVCYFFSATSSGGTNYWSRRLNGQGANFQTADLAEAAGTPCEFTCLPAGGWKNGGDILYVDDTDDRGGPVQLFFDTAFEQLGILDQVDRYDVLGPSSVVGNSLQSRVSLSNVATQISACYKKIIWSTGNLSNGLAGDGGTPNGGTSSEKADDYALFNIHLDTRSNNPGIYISGDDFAQDLISLGGASAITFRTTFMDFSMLGSAPGNHVASGEPISPCLVGQVGGCFYHTDGDSLIAYGGCALVNDFDPIGSNKLGGDVFAGGEGFDEMKSSSGLNYVVSQKTRNSVSPDTSLAGVILSGFSYHYIRNKQEAIGEDPARIHHLRDILIWLDNVVDEPTDVPKDAVAKNFLRSNYPNPFNPTTTIKYGVKEAGPVSLKIYNVAGQLVKTLIDEANVTPIAGGFIETWHGDNNAGQSVASGVYFYKLVTKNFTQTRKMVLLK